MKREILKDALNLSDLMVENKKKSKPSFEGVLYEKFKDDFGNDILRKIGENTVVVGGAITALEHLCGVSASWKPKTLNELYGVDQTTPPSGETTAKICLYGVGNGGSGLAFGSVLDRDIKRRDVPNLIPLRATDNLTDDDADRYFFPIHNNDGTTYYYLKELPVPAEIKTCWKDSADDEEDGTEVQSEVSESGRSEGLQTFADHIIDFNRYDIREYYQYIGAFESARYNSIGLFTADKTIIDDRPAYVNIRLFSYLNIENRSVKIKTEAEYLYRVLSLV